ncbi:MAG: hypothetical protein WBD47_16430 [Phormidesmis sp.]
MNSFTQFSSSGQFYDPYSPTQQAAAQRLERSLQAPQKTQSTASLSWTKRLGQWILQALTDSDQVRLWTKITPNGVQWFAYDPRTQRSFACHSEADLRVWLEQRYR